jgi:hypothetical protein
MPLSKEARQRLLDARLLKGERVNYQIFKQILEDDHDEHIDQRTFERDIKDLKTRIADRNDDDTTKALTYSRALESYVYEKGYFAFEETALIDGTDLGKLLKYNRNFITDMETELNKQIDSLIKEYSDYEDSKISWEPVAYQNKINEGQKLFTRILNYIVQQTPVEIVHQPLGQKAKDPRRYLFLLLKELDNNFAKGWYVLAQKLDDQLSEITLNVNNFNIIALDRIVSMKAFSSRTKINIEKGFDPKDYFKNAIKGLVRNNLNKSFKGHEPVTIKLAKNDVWIYQYVKVYKLHPSQILREEKDGIYIDFMIEIDQDLENLIYMYSRELIVIKPTSLKQTIIDRLHIALRNYE